MSAEIPFQRAVIFLLVGNRYLAKTRLFSPWYGKPEKSSLVCHHHYVIGKYRNQFFLLASSSTCTLPAANSPTCPLGNMPKVVTSFRAANTSNSVSMFGQVIRVLEIGRNTNELDGFSRLSNLYFHRISWNCKQLIIRCKLQYRVKLNVSKCLLLSQ